jgi:Divergent InlB B-repeat domain
VLVVSDAPAGTLISAGTLEPGDRGFVDPAGLEHALEREPGRARAITRLEGATATAAQVTKRVEEAEAVTRAALEGSLLDLDGLSGRIDVMLDLLEGLDRDDRHEESLRLARAINGLLALAMRWVDLVRSLDLALRAAEHVRGAAETLGWAQHELGTLHLAAEDAAGAEPRLEQARSIRQQLRDREGLAATEQNLSFVCRQQLREGRLARRRGPPRRLLAALAAVALLLAGGVAGAAIDPFDDDSGGAPRLTARVDGPGVVTSAPPGIRCPDRCDAEFASGRAVSLTAAARPGAAFAGWSGGCEGRAPCRVTVREPVTVTARFTAPPVPPGEVPLTVTPAGQGSGTVTSSPAGISCGQDCSEAFPRDGTVVLSAIADRGSAFTGWSGAGCGGTGTCSVTMSEARTVTAAFAAEAAQFTLTTTTSGPGTLEPSCPQGCLRDAGEMVTLVASPAPGNLVEEWSGCTADPPDATTCQVQMSEDRLVSVSFVEEPEG